MEQLTLKRKLSQSEFRKKAAAILGRLALETRPFADESAAARARRRERSLEDPFYFFATYLPHYFTEDCAAFHYDLVELMERRPGPGEVLVPVVVAAPREFAKTTLAAFGYVLHQIAHGRRRFIIIGSDTEDLASDLTGYLYLEMLYNERLRADFGELVQDYWAVDDFVTLNDVRLKARGRGQRLRGLKHKQWRPDLVVLDDLENDQAVKNPARVKDLLDWIKSAVYPAIDAGGSLFWIGTILARRSALATALKGEEEPWRHWERRTYRALQEDGTSLWPARHPVEKLLQQKRLMGSLAFNREKQNDPRDEEGMFREEWIRYYHPAELRGVPLVTVAYFDPSLETGAASDYKAIITVSLDWQAMVCYVRDAFIRRATLEQCYGVAYSRHEEFGFTLFGVEDNLFQKLLINEFQRQAADRKTWLPVRGVTSKVAKETRVSRLSPLVEKGLIRFERGQGDQDLLIEQLIYFPSRTVHDDGPDALEGALGLLEQVARPGALAYESLGKRRFGEMRGTW
jgi:predicted phage terminase large subunit-like protein